MNKFIQRFLFLVLATGHMPAEIFADSPPANAAISTKAVNTALVPVSKLEQDSYDWFKRHAEVLELQKKISPDIVLIGDSITHFWGGEPKARQQNGPQAWQDTFGKYTVLNMGFGWDRTQNVLWRLENGEMDSLKPKVIILNIGTNNFSGTKNARANSPEEVSEAILEICQRLHKKSPTSRIVVMGIFPRKNPEYLPKIRALNALLAQQLSRQSSVRFLDIGTKMMNPDGTVRSDIFSDGTHPNEKGYAIWGQSLIKEGILPTVTTKVE